MTTSKNPQNDQEEKSHDKVLAKQLTFSH